MNFEHIILVYIIPMLAWLTIISVTLRLLVKKQSSSATLSWLMLIYLVPVIGVLAYLIFGEIKLGSTRADAFRRLHPKYRAWLAHLSEQTDLISMPKNLRYRPLFDLNYRRLGIPCIRGNELHILNTAENIMQSIFGKRDILSIWYFIFGRIKAWWKMSRKPCLKRNNEE